MKIDLRRLLVSLLLALCSTAAVHTRLHAQTRADTAAILLNAAEQLQRDGRTDAAAAVLDLIGLRYADTPAASEVQRLRLAIRATPEPERSGRTELIVNGTLYGAWLGLAVPIIAEADGPAAYGLGLLAGAPAGFFLSRAYTRAHPVTRGQARAITFGGLWGTWQGLGLAEVFDIGEKDSCLPAEVGGGCYETDADASTRVAAAVAGGLAGIGTGALLARKPITAGTAATVTLSGLWGTWFGYGIADLTNAEDDKLLASVLVAGDAALVGAALVAPRWQLSESRARLISVGGIAGGLAALGIMLIANPDDVDHPVLVPMIGSAVGLGAAAYWTRDRAQTSPAGENDGGRGAFLNGNGKKWSFDVPQAALRVRDTQNGRKLGAYIPVLSARW